METATTQRIVVYGKYKIGKTSIKVILETVTMKNLQAIKQGFRLNRIRFSH